MGCTSSKSTEIHAEPAGTTPINSYKVAKGAVNSTGHGTRKKSTDSGISLSECHEPKDTSPFKKSAIAYEIPTGYPSKSNRMKRRSRVVLYSKSTRDVHVLTTSNEDSVVKSDAPNHLDLKQARADKLREQELHAVVARQRRREARARQVQERRAKLQNELEMIDEDPSDIEVDGNFHVNDDYDFAAEDCGPQHKDFGITERLSEDSDAF